MTPIKVTGRILPISEDTRRRNPELYPVIAPGCHITSQDGLGHGATPKPVQKRLRQDSRPLLNKLETEAYEWLKGCYPGYTIRAQAKRYKLGNGIWFKVDLTAIIEGVERAWEVKGPHVFRGGFENLKVAASVWPEVVFCLIWKDNGVWHEQSIYP